MIILKYMQGIIKFFGIIYVPGFDDGAGACKPDRNTQKWPGCRHATALEAFPHDFCTCQKNLHNILLSFNACEIKFITQVSQIWYYFQEGKFRK